MHLSDVVKITASHYFGIVPLHVNTEHQAAYLHTAAALLSSLPHSAHGSTEALRGSPGGSPEKPSPMPKLGALTVG